MGKYAIEISNQTVNLVSHDIVGANPTFLTKKSEIKARKDLTFLRDFCIIASERVKKGNNPK